MALPAKSYFFLRELTEPWGASLDDLACYAQEGLLRVSFLAVGIAVRTSNGREELASEPVLILNGPEALFAGDAWEVFRLGASRVHRFVSPASGAELHIEDGAGIPVRVEDLIVTRVERERFERAYDLAPSPASAPAGFGAVFTHNETYSAVTLDGQPFALGTRQAAVVRILHEASASGQPWVRGSDLLTEAGSNSPRLVDLFKTQPNWRSLIVPDGKGRWRLNIREQSGRRRAAFRRPYLRLVS